MDTVITLTGTELVLSGIAVVVLAVAVWLAGRVLLATAGTGEEGFAGGELEAFVESGAGAAR